MLDVSQIESWESSSLPPVHLWKPPFCGDMDLVIKANGDWVHEGSKIKRPNMVNLFARILWFEDDEYFLVTPAEKVRIQVEDAPFLITQWRFVEEGSEKVIEFSSLTGDIMRLGINCRIWMASPSPSQSQSQSQSQSHYVDSKPDSEGSQKREERPYISMRYGMKGMLHRNVFYHLAEYLEPVSTEQGEGLGLVSGGVPYLLMDNLSLMQSE